MSDSLFSTYERYGTNAERLAFTPDPPPTTGGVQPIYTWYATDTGVTWVYDTSWHAVAGPGGAIPSTVQGDMLYASGTNTLAALAKDTNATRYLSNTGASNNPAWAQVAIDTGVSGLGTGVATLLAAASTGTGGLVGSNSPVFVDDFDLAADGVRFSAADGVLTLLGLGNGADESLTIDLDNAGANTIAMASGTGATLLTWTGTLQAPAFYSTETWYVGSTSPPIGPVIANSPVQVKTVTELAIGETYHTGMSFYSEVANTEDDPGFSIMGGMFWDIRQYVNFNLSWANGHDLTNYIVVANGKTLGYYANVLFDSYYSGAGAVSIVDTIEFAPSVDATQIGTWSGLGMIAPALSNGAAVDTFYYIAAQDISTLTVSTAKGFLNYGAGKFVVDSAGDLLMAGNYQQLTEMTAPTAPAANGVRIFARDTGGKTELCALFNSGAVQQIAIEP